MRRLASRKSIKFNGTLHPNARTFTQQSDLVIFKMCLQLSVFGQCEVPRLYNQTSAEPPLLP